MRSRRYGWNNLSQARYLLAIISMVLNGQQDHSGQALSSGRSCPHSSVTSALVRGAGTVGCAVLAPFIPPDLPSLTVARPADNPHFSPGPPLRRLGSSLILRQSAARDLVAETKRGDL